MSDTPETDNAAMQYILAASDEACYDEPFADFARALETQRDEARAEVERLRKALQALFDSYKQLADCGDAGNWSLEEQPEGKQAMEALGIPTSPTQPEIFEAHGREWYRHDGGKRPINPTANVSALLQSPKDGHTEIESGYTASRLRWGPPKPGFWHIIGWRPADAPEKLPR